MKPRNPPAWSIGELSPSKAGTVKHYMPPPLNLPTPTRVCNASVRESLNLAALWSGCVMRPGSDHRHPSRGEG